MFDKAMDQHNTNMGKVSSPAYSADESLKTKLNDNLSSRSHAVISPLSEVCLMLQDILSAYPDDDQERFVYSTGKIQAHFQFKAQATANDVFNG